MFKKVYPPPRTETITLAPGNDVLLGPSASMTVSANGQDYIEYNSDLMTGYDDSDWVDY